MRISAFLSVTTLLGKGNPMRVIKLLHGLFKNAFQIDKRILKTLFEATESLILSNLGSDPSWITS